MSSLLCAACEVHVGTGSDWDGSIWDDSDDDFDWADTPASRADAATPANRDDDAGAVANDAAVSGDAALPLDAALPVDAGRDAGSDTPSPVFTVEDIAQVLARGSCGALQDCMGQTLLVDSLDGKDCVAYRTHVYLDRELHWLGKSIAAGRIHFAPAALAQCERSLVELGCAVQTSRWPSSCRDALAGQVTLDTRCALDQDCEGPAFCDKGLDSPSCPGACAEWVTAGLPCAASAECADGLSCRGGSCTAPLSEGDACTVRLGYGECPPGLVCQGAKDATTCQSIAAVYAGKAGDPCDAFGQLCGFGLVCQSQSGTKGTCTLLADAGDRCRPAIPSQCPIEQYCKDARAGVNTRAPAGKDGVCSDLPSDGMGCEAAIGCTGDAICLADDAMCHAFRSVGESCISGRECYGGVCRDGQCAAPLDCSF